RYALQQDQQTLQSATQGLSLSFHGDRQPMLLLVDVPARSDVVDVDAVVLRPIGVDHAKIAVSETAVFAPFPRHSCRAGIAQRILAKRFELGVERSLQALGQPLAVASGSAMQEQLGHLSWSNGVKASALPERMS